MALFLTFFLLIQRGTTEKAIQPQNSSSNP